MKIKIKLKNYYARNADSFLIFKNDKHYFITIIVFFKYTT